MLSNKVQGITIIKVENNIVWSVCWSVRSNFINAHLWAISYYSTTITLEKIISLSTQSYTQVLRCEIRVFFETDQLTFDLLSVTFSSSTSTSLPYDTQGCGVLGNLVNVRITSSSSTSSASPACTSSWGGYIKVKHLSMFFVPFLFSYMYMRAHHVTCKIPTNKWVFCCK